jgi:hypothetical protein
MIRPNILGGEYDREKFGLILCACQVLILHHFPLSSLELTHWTNLVNPSRLHFNRKFPKNISPMMRH